MPLYLVRWGSTLTVSLVRANSEEQLADILDEVGDPGSCTWSVYKGPLMIDLAVPIEIEAPRDITGVVRAGVVKIQRSDVLEGQPLAVREPDHCDTVYEMKEAVLREAFPVLARAVEDSREDVLDVDVVCRAVAQDVEAQSKRLQSVGVTFGDDVELLRTRALVFRLKTAGSFDEIAITKANDFCAGLHRLKPDAEGFVRLAFVDVALRRRSPVSAVISTALKLRASPNGTIITPHRADAFEKESTEKSRSPMHRRRNETVSWTLSSKERTALQSAVSEHVGRRVPLTVRST